VQKTQPTPYKGVIADPVSSSLKGLCPRCGNGKLFTGFLTVQPKCHSCELDFKFADAGDGPAVFVILIAGFLILFSVLYVQIVYDPPTWVIMAIFLPLTVVICLGMLRPLKGLAIGLQYRNKAEQGRLEK
jgi:uncharacterized protein (DUF983 family)